LACTSRSRKKTQVVKLRKLRIYGVCHKNDINKLNHKTFNTFAFEAMATSVLSYSERAARTDGPIHRSAASTLASDANFDLKLLIDQHYLKEQIRPQMPD
jgi:hypothetical protein